MRITAIVSTFIAATVLAPCAMAQENAATLEQRVERIDAYAGRLHDLGVFDGVVVVARGERVLLAKGYGMADKESQRAWSPDTVSTVGSITKQFTGAAIMALAQEGRIDVQDTIAKFFPDAPADKASITIHQLLTHSAGFPGGIGNDEDFIDRDDYLALAWSKPLRFAPGTRYDYSNVGYSIVAAIVEKVSGKPYEAFVRERLFLPAGMESTGYLAPRFAPERLATGYQNGKKWGTVVDRQTHDEFSWHLTGNGGMHSTARDMHRWWLAIRDNTILDAKHTEMYLTPHQNEGGGDTFYGYGWVNAEAPDGQRMLMHNGGNGIFFADCAFFPESDLFAFVMLNDAPSAAGDSLQVFRSLAGGDLPMPIDPESVDADAVRRIARERALAWVEAANAGPDAYVQYGFDHRMDQGADEQLNDARRRAAADIANEHGRLEILGDDSRLLGTHEVVVRGSKSGDRIVIAVTVSAEPPHRVERIGLRAG